MGALSVATNPHMIPQPPQTQTGFFTPPDSFTAHIKRISEISAVFYPSSWAPGKRSFSQPWLVGL